MRAVKTFTHKGFKIEIHWEQEIYTADILDDRPGMVPRITWSLNTFRPKSLADAITGAKYIIDHPPSFERFERKAVV